MAICGWNGGGLARFNGKDFKVFTRKDGLIDDQIIQLLEDSQKNIWIVTFRGLSKYDGSKFYNYTAQNGFYQSGRYIMLEDHKWAGRIWMSLYNIKAGIVEFGFLKDTTFFYFSLSKDLDAESVRWGVDHKGVVWLHAQKKILRFDGTDFLIFEESSGIPIGAISRMFVDRENNMWFATRGNGLYRYMGNRFSVFSTKSGLKSNMIRSIYQQADGSIWFGSKINFLPAYE